ncbi:MAG: sensor histidine kinase [Cytophagaceae bacterium]|nr:MAG: sensor histidine kinase [Cytophagaceae bacterium]
MPTEFPQERTKASLARLATYFDEQQESILQAWRRAVAQDERLKIVSRMGRRAFEDNVRASLNLLSQRLRQGQGFLQEGSTEGNPTAPWEDSQLAQHSSEHGLHRWQEGYDLRDLVLEWGHMHLCLLNTLNDFEIQHPDLERAAINEGRCIVGQMVNGCYSQSVTEFHRLQQAEAKEVVYGLNTVIDQLGKWEQQRGHLLREAVHDLRGHLTTIQTASHVLDTILQTQSDPSATLPTGFATPNMLLGILRRGTQAHFQLLTDLLDLARLEAGQEELQVAPFNVGVLLGEFVISMEPVAQAKGLYLTSVGPLSLEGEGDALKVRRIVQNLVVNALKYTEKGGITLSWGQKEQRVVDSEERSRNGIPLWYIRVADTGPGLSSGLSADIATEREMGSEHTAKAGTSPLIQALMEASPLQQEYNKRTDTSHPEKATEAEKVRAQKNAKGEGVGLVIVRRLCALLKAELEVETVVGQGTTFVVTFPGLYT